MRHILNVHCEERVLTHMVGIPYKVFPHWYGASARALCLDLILPKQPEYRDHLPVIVWICGGAFATMDRSVWLPTLMDYARQGFAVAGVDYRTAPLWPFPSAVEDVRAAIRWLRAHAAEYGLDPARIVTMGESAGGYLACMAALGGSEYDVGENLDQSSIPQALVDYYGKVDFALDGSDPGCNQQVRDDFLRGDTSQERLEQISCRNLVTSDTPPTLIIHGDQDPLVPLAESERFYDALQAQSVRSELYVIHGAGHGEDCFYQPNIRTVIMSFLHDVL